MIDIRFIFVTLLLTACQAKAGASQSEMPLEGPPQALSSTPIKISESGPGDLSDELRGLDAKQISGISCQGVFEQGGAALCQTVADAKVKIARSETDYYFENANEDGQILIGFDRDEAGGFVEADGQRVDFEIAARDYKISRIDGLPPSQVSTYTEAQLAHIRASSAKKKIGFASRAQNLMFENGFSYPLKDFVKTSPFGAQRILNGEPKSPHYGVDIAAPTGTTIYAPAGGKIVLADDDLYFEGAMVMIDHGQGFTSMYLHVSEIFVEAGQIVAEGDKIAAVGSEGRSTGPHLCWRLKWRNRNIDPELLTRWPGR